MDESKVTGKQYEQLKQEGAKIHALKKALPAKGTQRAKFEERLEEILADDLKVFRERVNGDKSFVARCVEVGANPTNEELQQLEEEHARFMKAMEDGRELMVRRLRALVAETDVDDDAEE